MGLTVACFFLLICNAIGYVTDRTNSTWIDKTKPKPRPTVGAKSKPKPVSERNRSVTDDASVVSARISNVFGDDQNAQFGFSIAISSASDVIAIGVPFGRSGAGGVQMCQGYNLSECYQITETSERHADFEMGYSVDISEHGNTLITTAKTQRRMFTSDWDYVTMDDVHIYIYEKDSFGLYFTLEQIILVHSQNEEIDMPVSLHFADNSFIAGLPWLSYSTFKGHAYVYERCIDSGLYVRAGDLTGAENLNYDDSFGAAVALSGNHAFVGAVETFDAQGAVYFYSKNGISKTWSLQQVLAPPCIMSNASSIYFGYSIAVKGLLSLYVGAPGLNSNTGSVFAFGFIVDGDSVGSYVLMTTFSAADGQTNDMFGYSLAVSAAGLLAVGAPGQSVYESGSGAVYLFDISTGMQLQIYIPECAFSETNECTGNAFGQSVGLSGLNKEENVIIVIGAYCAHGFEMGSGAVYVVNTSFFTETDDTDTSNSIKLLSLTEILFLTLMLALPCIAIITAIALRFNAKTLFERVNGSGKVIDLRLDVENNFSHSSDEYDDATDEIHNAIFFLHTPGSQRPETLRSPDTRLVPIHVPGKCSEDNPFRRISMVSPVSSPLLIAGDRHMAPPVGSE